MHTQEFDQQTEQLLNQLAALSGKTPDEFLREITISSIKKRAHKLAIPTQYSFSADSSQADWDTFFTEFSRPVVVVTPCPREEIYGDRLR